MKERKLRFFSPNENVEKTQKVSKKEEPLTCSISLTGRLVFPLSTAEQLGMTDENTDYRIGMEEGKRKVKSLYLVPADTQGDDTFKFVKTGRSFTVPLHGILKSLNLDYTTTLFTFAVTPFSFGNGVSGLELKLAGQVEREKREGEPKKRGRKPRSASVDSAE
ncbi:hypothetical protein [Tellurirhabdus rosea]|uniref:hypothetical protein n=1 Tax=Tellurirhabdus rosea TaxID=2674997 RepID=UPI002256BC42|nr:hypothetical protein [Tellurirhabdus rosea]